MLTATTKGISLSCADVFIMVLGVDVLYIKQVLFTSCQMPWHCLAPLPNADLMKNLRIFLARDLLCTSLGLSSQNC